MRWTEHASITPTGRGSFTAHVDEHWLALQGVHGGVMAVLLVEATDAVLGEQAPAARRTR